MKMVKCAACDELHPLAAVEISFTEPDATMVAGRAGVPREKLTKDVKYGYKVSEDVAYLKLRNEDIRWFIRCVVPLPLVGSEDFYNIGAWAEVSDETFHVIMDNWDNPFQGQLPELDARLANTIPFTDGSYGAVCQLKMTTLDDRPKLIIVEETCSLRKEQQEGITLERVERFNSIFANRAVEIPGI